MSMQPDNRTPLIEPGFFRTFLSQKLKVSMVFPEDSPFTDQSFAADADINTIMARYQSTGEIPLVNQAYPQFLDVTEQDFQEHMNIVAEANQLFSELPSRLRDRFGNDPAAFLGFVSDEDNRVEMARLGLLSDDAARALLNPTPPTQPTQTQALGGSQPPYDGS